MNKLKNCPFCGNQAHIYRTMHGEWAVGCDIVSHPGCGTVVIRMDKQKAIKVWNTRVGDDTWQQKY